MRSVASTPDNSPLATASRGRALPGALTGLGIAGLALIAGFVLWLTTFINRSNRRTAIEPEEKR